jgi:hypothetical protein
MPISVKHIAALLQEMDKLEKIDLDGTVAKRYANVTAGLNREVGELVENVTEEQDYKRLAVKVLNHVKEVLAANTAAKKTAVTYPKPVIKPQACKRDKKVMEKIESVAAMGPSHRGTPGPKSLGSKTLHTHVTNQDAIAYVFKGDVLNVIGYGRKSGQAGKDDSGYAWETD